MSTTTTDESIGWWWCRAMESECATKTRHTVPQAVVGNQLSKAARSGRPRRWIEIDVPWLSMCKCFLHRHGKSYVKGVTMPRVSMVQAPPGHLHSCSLV
uniref:Uncharacterized protein n=1 Tax=Panagrellus redivivus TaxID=6233 RepID=A0A7E4W9V1_PANRE